MASTITEMLRRRFGGEKDDGYIKDGLVLRLDGINRGTADNDKWIDLAGGRVFTLYNCIIGSNHVKFSGQTTCYGSYESNESFGNGTIECTAVAENIGFSYCEHNGLMARITNGSQFVFNSFDRTRGRVIMGGICNSANNNVAVINGVNRTELLATADFDGNSSDIITIGKRISNPQGPFRGKIYAIRVYNRKLTVDEMIHNQRIDNERFQLGLTI